MGHFICPHCQNPVYDKDALLCLFCGRSLGRSCGPMSFLKSARFKAALATAVILIILSFVFLILR